MLVHPRNPLNIGAAARAMSNFGFERMRVVNPYELAFQEVRSAVGASAVVERAEEFSSVADAVADCGLVIGTSGGRARSFQQPVKILADAAPEICSATQQHRVALLFGSEKTGLSNTDLSYCNFVLRIPTRGEHASMNLGQAVAVCLYEIARQVLKGEPTRTSQSSSENQRDTLASSAEIERLTRALLEALRVSGYVNDSAIAGAEEKVRRLMLRMALSPEDAALWQGILRQILWKMRSGK